jgi:glucose-6-phosphate-specific signal transduction histidine kinase
LAQPARVPALAQALGDASVEFELSDRRVGAIVDGRKDAAGDRERRLLHRGRGAGQRRQASAADRMSVRLARQDGHLEIEIGDDGRGGATLGDHGAGLRSIADRVDVFGGQLRIESPVGGGTRLIARIPCGS